MAVPPVFPARFEVSCIQWLSLPCIEADFVVSIALLILVLLATLRFIQVVQAIVSADESLFKSTRSAIMKVDFPGLVTAQFAEMIQVGLARFIITEYGGGGGGGS